jgi:Zn finger protein HypA/HybF involved in hydrogenase expression
MHELSIATSIFELAQRYVPPGHVLQRVQVRAGSLRGIEPQAMQFAWRACTYGIDAEHSKLDLEIVDGDELKLLSIDIDDADDVKERHYESRRH